MVSLTTLSTAFQKLYSRFSGIERSRQFQPSRRPKTHHLANRKSSILIGFGQTFTGVIVGAGSPVFAEGRFACCLRGKLLLSESWLQREHREDVPLAAAKNGTCKGCCLVWKVRGVQLCFGDSYDVAVAAIRAQEWRFHVRL